MHGLVLQFLYEIVGVRLLLETKTRQLLQICTTYFSYPYSIAIFTALLLRSPLRQTNTIMSSSSGKSYPYKTLKCSGDILNASGNWPTAKYDQRSNCSEFNVCAMRVHFRRQERIKTLESHNFNVCIFFLSQYRNSDINK